jgi:cold shock CspA family protein
VAQERSERPEAGERKWSKTLGAPSGGRVQDRPDRDDLLARLDRLEAVVMAIAEHLGVRPGRVPPRPPAGRRAGAGGGWQGPGEGMHAVVRTVARGIMGRVKQYNTSRGFGFVLSSEAPGDVFFHRSDCRIDPSTLEPGAEVAFDLVEMANGQLKAVRLGPPRRERPPAPSASGAGRRQVFPRPAKGRAVAPASQQPQQ